jgi:hypothetical protein
LVVIGPSGFIGESGTIAYVKMAPNGKTIIFVSIVRTSCI